MKRRTIWTTLFSCLLVSVNLLFGAMIFASLVYAFVLIGYLFAEAFLFD